MQSAPALPSKRLYYLDIIKVLCLAFVFLFHCFKIFDADTWYVKNETRIDIKAGYIYELGLAVMPGFFVISGASIWLSMQKRSGFVFLQNIFKRFFFPLLFGLSLLAIPQIYFEFISQGKFNGNLISFLPYYWQKLQTTESFFWAVHLWFLVLLFIFSLVMIPFFVVGKKYLPLPLFQKIINSPLVLLLLAAVLVVPGWKLHPNGILGMVWAGWNLFQNLIFFAAGFILFSSPQFVGNAQKHKWPMLVVAVLLTAVLVYTYKDNDQLVFRSAEYNLKLALRAVACWAWISSVMGITSQYFSGETRFIKYWTVAAMPFYILSQPVIVAIGFYVVNWPLSIFAKYTIITLASFALTILLYEGIKRNGVLRWMFGIPRKSSVKNIRKKLPGKAIAKTFFNSKGDSGTVSVPTK